MGQGQGIGFSIHTTLWLIDYFKFYYGLSIHKQY